MQKRLYRSTSDKKLAGVCGGLGAYFNVDPTVIRLAAILLFVLSGFIPVGLAYIIAIIVIPEEPATGTKSN